MQPAKVDELRHTGAGDWLHSSSIGCYFLLTLLVGVAISRYLKSRKDYWNTLGIKGDPPLPLVGDIYHLLLKDRLKSERDQVRRHGKVYGTFLLGRPRLVVADAEVMRQICIKDSHVFPDHIFRPRMNKYQRNFLLHVRKEDWKRHRSLMSPTFTSCKIRRMFRFLEGCADDLLANIGEQIDRAGGECAVINSQETYGMFTMDGISTCGYGIKLQRSSSSGVAVESDATRDSFAEATKQILQKRLLREIIIAVLPTKLVDLLGLRSIAESDYLPMVERVSKLIEIRKQSSKKHDDLLQLLLDARQGDQMELGEMDQAENHHIGVDDNKALLDEQSSEQTSEESDQTSKVQLSEMEVLSEAIFLMAAGYDTTQVLLITCTYALAHHPDIQQRLYEELKSITKARSGQDSAELDYESITFCKYLDAVISESLRYLPPAPLTDRVAERDYVIEKYNIPVPKGRSIFLAISSVQNDPDYWDEPEKFRPERFFPGEREKIVPGSYMPFSMGPRHCLGMRFALTEAKIGVAKTILHYELTPAPGTSFPPQLKRRGLGLLSLKKPLICVRRRN